MQGKSLALVLDRFNEMRPAGQQGMNLGQAPVFVPLDTGLEKLLSHYGIRIQQSFVMDENCYRQEMPAQFGGGERAIYFAPLIKDRFINNDLEFMKNIKRLVALKISPLELDSERITQNSLKNPQTVCFLGKILANARSNQFKPHVYQAAGFIRGYAELPAGLYPRRQISELFCG